MIGKMEDSAGRFAVYGKTLRETDAEAVAAVAPANSSVYEVIRIIDGVPLFFEDHYTRMSSSLKSQGIDPAIPESDVRTGISKLLTAEGKGICNVKISINVNDGKPEPWYYISKSVYPSEDVVKAGVRTGLLMLERNNPNAKILNYSYREAVGKRMVEGGFFEVLLVNGDGNITEGSKSNVFFVKGDRLFTAPGSHVLLGVTRKYVMEACRLAGFTIDESFISVDDLCSIDGLFLSGTSIKVLPVSSIDGVEYGSPDNQAIAAVARQYDDIIRKYIRDNS